MAAKSPRRRRASCTVAAIVKHNGDDDPRLVPLRAELAAATLEEHVELALDDPVALARAAAIVRSALNRGRLARADLDTGDAA